MEKNTAPNTKPFIVKSGSSAGSFTAVSFSAIKAFVTIAPIRCPFRENSYRRN